MAREREEIKRKKAEAREAERRRKAELKLANRENHSSKSRCAKKGGLQEAEISSSECAACFGLYEDDFVDGQLMQEWIQCTDPDCGKWMHINCLNTDSNGEMYICSVCKTTFC